MEQSARFASLGQRMREEWDRRILHDYRYWMSDGVASDELMWQSGERDLTLLFTGLSAELLSAATVLELGCGVGRLLRAASKQCRKVVGIDVSVEALNRAKVLIAELENVELKQGNGADISCLEDNSLDGAYSFAALGSMPVAVQAAYLKELSRVVRPGGFIRIQIYLGKPQETVEEDTIVLRSFDSGCFRRAVEAAGLEWLGSSEVVLPFEVSDHEAGVVAEIVSLRALRASQLSADEIARYLVPAGEATAGKLWAGSSTEYLMALARAKQHMEAGNAQEARRALEFAASYYKEVDPEVEELLAELRKERDSLDNITMETTGVGRSAGEIGATGEPNAMLEANLVVLRQRFPLIAKLVETAARPEGLEFSRNGAGAQVVSFKGAPLAHPEKPERAAESWAQQSLYTQRVREASNIIVGGLGLGYHLEALKRLYRGAVHLFEPCPGLLRVALENRDLRSLIDSLASISYDEPTLKENVGELVSQTTVESLTYPPSRLAAPEAYDTVKRLLVSSRGLKEVSPRIAVVGPMYGGSLPISYYTSHGFQILKQKVHGYDFKSFYKPFCELSSILKTQSRKDVVESQFVEVLSQSLLEGLAERPVDILVCLAQAPVSPKALEEIRSRGIITVMWFVEDYMRFQTWKMLAPYFDYMFMIQKGKCLTEVEAAGAGRAYYLPVACDPVVHRPISLTVDEKQRYGSDISFLGAGYNNRRHVFSFLANRDFKIWGTEWPAMMPFTKLVQDGGRRVDPEEYVKVFNASKINLNLHSSSERDGVEPNGDFVNPRTFELAACGGFQLVDERTLLGEMFEIGKEVAVFHDSGEMIEKIDYYLAHPEERDEIVEASRQRVLRDHTYDQRLRQMLEYIYLDRYDYLKSRAETSPWKHTMEAAKDLPRLLPRLQKACDRGDDPVLSSLVSDIQTGKGTLADEEQKLLFLHHLHSQIEMVQDLRKEKA